MEIDILSEIRRAMGERNIHSHLVAYGPRGSVAHGTTTDQGIDDVDLFAVYAGTYLDYVGIRPYQESFNTNGEHIDIEAVELRKFMSLLRKSNPNVHSYLWTDGISVPCRAFDLVRECRQQLLSQRLLASIAGYVHGQIALLERDCKNRYMGTKREELRQKYGYDIKAGAHAIRLLRQGVLLAMRHELVVKPEGTDRYLVMEVKTGSFAKNDFMRLLTENFHEFDNVRKYTKLPENIPEGLLEDLTEKMMQEIHAIG